MRRYSFEHIMNMRDMGGYPLKLKPGEIIAYRKFIRSDAPYKMKKDKLNFLFDIAPIIVDLRSKEEYLDLPTIFHNQDDFLVTYIPIIGGLDWDLYDGNVPECYMGMTRNDSIPRIFFCICPS